MGLSKNIETHRGDDDYFVAVVYEPDGSGGLTERDISTDSLFFAVKSSESDNSDSYSFSKSNSNITKTDATNGEYKVSWDDTDTVNLNIDDYFYAVELTDSLGAKKTILEGKFTVLPDVVRQ